MSVLKKYLELSQKLTSLQREVDQATGALNLKKKELESFGCHSLKEAKSLLKRMTAQLQEEEEKFQEQMEEFEEKWKEVLE